MAKIQIVHSLFEEIQKRFGGEAHEIIDLMETLESNPTKGKLFGNVGRIVIKEIRYKSFRFYFITDGFKLKFLDEQSLNDILIKFVRMSDKKTQQKTIEEIKIVLRQIGEEGF